jgi:AraC-like DNA-binding protein
MPSRVLLRMPDVTLGEFLCVPGDPAWDEVNTNMGAWPHVVFPRHHVVIAQEGAAPVLTTPNNVVFYKPFQRYRRALRDPRGDRCLWLEVSPERWRAPEAPAGPCDARTYLLAVALGRHLLTEPQPDRLLAEEATLQLLSVGGGHAGETGRRPRTRSDHAELVEAAKELLTQRMGEPPSLRGIAEALNVSRFHLARVFRARTGFSLSAYVHGLRLKRAVDRLAAEPGVDLSRLAVELGYCSPSHFSDRFRVAFGAPPSQLRGAQLSTIVEASSPRAA